MTILDRVEMCVDEQRDKEFCNVAFRPELDHNQNWVCSLRQGEHDNEFDGMRTFTEMNTRAAKNIFHKRRQTFDQKFISEDDQPLTSRRTSLTYYTKVAQKDYPNNYSGKYIVRSRLPQIQKQVMGKSLPYKTRVYVQN